MRVLCFNGSEQIIAEIEENDYKPKLTLTQGLVSISVEIHDDLDELLYGRMEAKIECLEDDVQDLKEEISGLREELEQCQVEKDSLIDDIKELEEALERCGG